MLGLLFIIISLALVIPYNKVLIRRWLQEKATLGENILNLLVNFAIAGIGVFLIIVSSNDISQRQVALSGGLSGIVASIPFLVSSIQFYRGLRREILQRPTEFIWDGHIDPTLSNLNGIFMAYFILGVQALNLGLILIVYTYFGASLLILLELTAVVIGQLIFVKWYPHHFEKQLVIVQTSQGKDNGD